MDRHRPSVPRRDRGHDRQAESCTAIGPCGVELDEPVEDPLAVNGRHAGSVIRHDELGVTVDESQRHLDPGAGVPHGVFTLAQLETTVEGMAFASDIADQSTWFPVSELMP